MKIIAIVVMSAALAAAQDPSAKPADNSRNKAIPAGATQVAPNQYRYTDAQGKVWLYRSTPFGVSKWEENTVPEPKTQEAIPPRVTDLGDSVQFERSTPFGSAKWTKKKADLTDEEKAWAEPVKAGESVPVSSGGEKK